MSAASIAKHPRLRAHVAIVASVCCALLWAPFAACGGERATPTDCDAILHRIVTLELRERGFRDPALARRKQSELEELFARELGQCTGRRLRHAALACVERAISAEQISHGCLR
jgi:hypothetical protein